MGYRVAILPGLLLTAVLQACDVALTRLRETGDPPASANGPTVREQFRRLGSQEWDALRRPLAQAAE